MRRLLCLALLAGWTLPLLAAEAPSVCKSICAGEQQTCRRSAQRKTELDEGTAFDLRDQKNPMARAADRSRLETVADRAPAQAGAQNRRLERTAACDQGYARCVRACAAPPEVLSKQGRTKAARSAEAPANAGH